MQHIIVEAVSVDKRRAALTLAFSAAKSCKNKRRKPT